MPTVTPRVRADGTITYVARLRIKAGGKVVHDEAASFSRDKLAHEWLRVRQAEIRNGAAAPPEDQRTVGDVLDWYIAAFGEAGSWQRTKNADLKRLQRMDIASKRAVSLTAADVVDHVRKRRAAGTGPSTAMNDVVWLGVAFRAGRGALGLPLPTDIFRDALSTARSLRLIARSAQRDRRPTADELARLDAYFSRDDGRRQIPMADIVWFAVYSARRESEITRLRWDAYDRKAGTIMVPDVKHPRAKIGNHRMARLSPEAIAIIDAQPRIAPEIFPYKANSIGEAFARACGMLGINDLRFHDLRHEATSRLFEAGYQIHEVALFTLHSSWAALKRYTNLRPKDLQARSLARDGDRPTNGSCSIL